MQNLLTRAAVAAVLLTLAGCASVTVSTQETSQYIEQRRGDVITRGSLSQKTLSALYVLGLDAKHCSADLSACIDRVLQSQALSTEEQLSALSEIWLYKALAHKKTFERDRFTLESTERGALQDEILNAYLESARHAWAYLFYTDRSINLRALEDRQTQVRDYYNFSTQSAVETLFDRYRKLPQDEKAAFSIEAAGWRIEVDNSTLKSFIVEGEKALAVTADTTVTFKGLRNQYERDGIGARSIVTLSSGSGTDLVSRIKDKARPWRKMPYSSITSVFVFPDETFPLMMTQKRVRLVNHHPADATQITVNGKTVPLAVNYSAAYGMWLANSDFATQSIRTVFGKGDILQSPRLYLMQPYNKDLKTIILIHGLASSPEAWVNAANEMMGDERLRNRYQIWQIYYPTSAPLIVNRHDIAQVIEETLNAFDPGRQNPASRDIVLIGHSMGGILSRILVSDSGNLLYDAALKKYPLARHFEEQVKEKFGEYMFFKPLPEVTRAVFLAAPHRGAPIADTGIARFVAKLVRMPISALGTFKNAALVIFGQDVPFDEMPASGVDNLSEKDPVIGLLAKMPVSKTVRYHSIIGRHDPASPVAESTDGIVPYSSSHWEGAESELIVTSGHSVQETPQAIMELRRILLGHLESLGTKPDF